MCKLQNQHNYYTEHKSSLLQKYEGKYLVITEKNDVLPFDTRAEAYTFGAQQYGLGNFMIKKCVAGNSAIQSLSNLALRVL